MISANIASELIKLGVSREALEIVSEDSFLDPISFSIKNCVEKNINYNDIILLIQFVYEFSRFVAERMYSVIIDNLTPTSNIIIEPVKKKRQQ